MNNKNDDNNLMVYSCRGCRQILGDSLSLIYNHKDLESITLSGVTNKVAPEHTLHTSSDSIDRGATYYNLFCTECVQVIGKQYLTTPRSLDILREKYTIHLEQLYIYELGKVDVGISGQEEFDLQKAQSSSRTSAEAEDIAKIQHVLVDLVLRLAEVERLLGLASSVPVATVEETANHLVSHSSSSKTSSSSITSPVSSSSGMKRSAIQQQQQLSSLALAQSPSTSTNFRSHGASYNSSNRQIIDNDPKRRKLSSH